MKMERNEKLLQRKQVQLKPEVDEAGPKQEVTFNPDRKSVLDGDPSRCHILHKPLRHNTGVRRVSEGDCSYGFGEMHHQRAPFSFGASSGLQREEL